MFCESFRNEIHEEFEKNRIIHGLSKMFWLPFLSYKVYRKRKQIRFHYTELVVTTACTLHCKKCGNMLQFYKQTGNIPFPQIERDLKVFFDCIDSIDVFGVLGGEPLLHPDLPQILQLIADCPKIQNCILITNGTLMPSDALLNVLKRNTKISVEISNYYEKSKHMNDLLTIFTQNNIKCNVRSPLWNDYHHSKEKVRSPEDNQKIYQRCLTRECHSVFNGKFYLCPVSAHGAGVGLFPQSDYLELNEKMSQNDLRSNLKHMLELKTLTACRFCDGRAENDPTVIPVAEQLPEGTFISPETFEITSK